MSIAPGTRLGAYEIVATLGAGGMGEVYRARDPRLGREVAIKVLHRDVSQRPDRLARFEFEARTVAGLNHPNIVTLHSIDEVGGIRFITMELVEGETLAGSITPGGLPVSRVLAIAIPLADALAAAHGRQVVHRDLKPANVMLTPEGRVKVLDFGLAKSFDLQSPLSTRAETAAGPISVVGELAGTVAYMAPEQLRGLTVDARTDLFAFGIILFELLAGRRPFGGGTVAEVGASILHEEPPALTTLRQDVPAALAQLVARCLEKDSERRVSSAHEVRDALESIRQGLESGKLMAAAIPAAAAGPAAAVAVLPFANRGGSADDAYFADGITEDVITNLCKVRTLSVISRTSVMAFRDFEGRLEEVAAELGADHVLTGSIRRAGDRVRIVAQLVDVSNGRSLWAETYDRHLTDIFEVQTDVALHIVSALEVELSTEERRRIRREPTRDVEAYEHYMRGRHRFVQFTREAMLESLEHFERALARDPRFVLGHVGIAMACAELSEIDRLGRGTYGPRALAAAARALAVDAEVGEAHCADGQAKAVFAFDWAGAEVSFKRAIALSPSHADSYDFYGRLLAGVGRFDEAIAMQQRAFALDPLAHRTDIATAFLRAGRPAEAERAARRAINLAPADPRPRATLGWALLRQERRAEGVAELERAAFMAPGEAIWSAQLAQAYGLMGNAAAAHAILTALEDPGRERAVSPYHLAYAYTGLGDHERAIDLLERALDAGTVGMLALKGSFLFEPLRGHPRFRALLERMGVP